MIKIERDDLPQIRDEFYCHLTEWLVDRRSKKNRKSLIDTWIKCASNADDTPYVAMLTFLRDNFDRIIKINSVNELLSVNTEFNNQFSFEIQQWRDAEKDTKKGTSYGKFKAKMNSLYENFMSDGKLGFNIGLWFSKKLNIITCPYCNRHYTFTIDKTSTHPVVRPQFDHFLPKSKYPLTAVTPFNIVPACPECNKTKDENCISIHPYEDSFDKHDMRFAIDEPFGSKSKVSILNGIGHLNVETLALIELYEQHHDIAEDIVNKAQAYNATYYDSLISNYSGLPLSIRSLIVCLSIDAISKRMVHINDAMGLSLPSGFNVSRL